MAKHPYCRTCGSKINSDKVCPYCGCEPLKGNSYCCDCGTSTLPQAIMCVQCGASLQKRFPATLAILLGASLAIAIAGTTYFISENNSSSSENHEENPKITNTNFKTNRDSLNTKINPGKKGELLNNPISNNLLLRSSKKKNDIIARITKNIVPLNTRQANDVPKPVKPRLEANNDADNSPPAFGKMSMNSFSSSELQRNAASCSYFAGSKKNVVFFTNYVFGFIKMNGKTYELQGVEKGNDIARFAGTFFDVTIEIEGLSGNENQWVASCIMTVKDKKQRILSKGKVYSSCTEF